MKLSPQRRENLVFLFILLTCAATRLFRLDERGVMHDESLFVYYTWFHIVENLNYDYQPILHGPAMLWIQAALFSVLGDSTFVMRLGCALLGIGGLFWIRGMRPWLGPWGMLTACCFYTLSPTLMFYQRFFRNDGLFVFTTLWMIVSLAHWWKSRNHAWLASFVFASIVLFCNKESCVFVYFTLITFALLVVTHDVARWIIENCKTTESIPSPLPALPLWPVALTGFTIITLFLTRVLEGISYETSVVSAIGRDFPLKNVQSLPLALGWHAPVESAGTLGEPSFWRLFYCLLFAGSLASTWLVNILIRHRIGARTLTAEIWRRTIEARWWITAAAGTGLALYIALFTTVFVYPAGPFEIYQDTLEYWMGQNAQHRIKGPFHMHLLNMLVYETGPLLLVLAASLFALFRMKWSRTLASGLLPAAAALAIFHGLFFRGLDPGMSWFATLSAGIVVTATAIALKPSAGRLITVLAFTLFVAWSFHHFHSQSWELFLFSETQRGGEKLSWSGKAYLDDTLSLTSGVHLFLIGFLIMIGTILTWRGIHRGERFHALLIWWLVTIIGAVSYAREKVPWVGIYITLPLVLLTGAYVQKFANHLQTLKPSGRILLQSLSTVVLGTAAILSARSGILLSFINFDTVRERMIYAHPAREVKIHTELVLRTAATSEDDTTVRTYVGSPELQWPMRWYLRNLDWDMGMLPTEGQAPDYDFLFLKEETHSNDVWIRENYELFDGRAHMHWVPQQTDLKAIYLPWKDSEASLRVWKGFWRYYWLRELPGTGQYKGLSWVSYVFAVRKDIADSVGEPIPDVDDPSV